MEWQCGVRCTDDEDQGRNAYIVCCGRVKYNTTALIVKPYKIGFPAWTASTALVFRNGSLGFSCAYNYCRNRCHIAMRYNTYMNYKLRAYVVCVQKPSTMVLHKTSYLTPDAFIATSRPIAMLPFLVVLRRLLVAANVFVTALKPRFIPR